LTPNEFLFSGVVTPHLFANAMAQDPIPTFHFASPGERVRWMDIRLRHISETHPSMPTRGTPSPFSSCGVRSHSIERAPRLFKLPLNLFPFLSVTVFFSRQPESDLQHPSGYVRPAVPFPRAASCFSPIKVPRSVLFYRVRALELRLVQLPW